MTANAAKNPEHRLNKEWRLHKPCIDKIFQVIKMPDIITFKFKTRAVFQAHFHDRFDIFECIAEDNRLITQMCAFPLIFQIIFVTVQHREQTEIDCAHIQGCQLWLECRSRFHAFFDCHLWRAACGNVNDGIGCIGNLRQKARKHLRILCRAAILRITGMQMQYRRPFIGCGNCSFCNFIRCHRQILRH